jgi:hypothetical protein
MKTLLVLFLLTCSAFAQNHSTFGGYIGDLPTAAATEVSAIDASDTALDVVAIGVRLQQAAQRGFGCTFDVWLQDGTNSSDHLTVFAGHKSASLVFSVPFHVNVGETVSIQVLSQVCPAGTVPAAQVNVTAQYHAL